jgi:hypothetical protein
VFEKIESVNNFFKNFKNGEIHDNLQSEMKPGFVGRMVFSREPGDCVLRKRNGLMIAYDLQCAGGHAFEGWFEDSKAYEAQKKQGFITCPICNDTAVYRVPSTFAIKTAHAGRDEDGRQMDMAVVGKKIVDFVEKNFDNVGCDFAKEALKIHYGSSEARNIRGFSTKEEEKMLKKEGVQFFKIPVPAMPDTDA